MPGPIINIIPDFTGNPGDNPGNNGDFNNKAKYIATTILPREVEYPYFEMTEQINRLRTFTIGRDEQGVAMLHYRKSVNGALQSYHATMLFTPGAGTYGKDATPVNQSDFLIISNTFANPLTDLNANFIDLGEIGDAAVHQFIIDSGFVFDVKQQETNYFRALRNGIDHTYIYSNRIEKYPQAGELLELTDFELLAKGGDLISGTEGNNKARWLFALSFPGESPDAVQRLAEAINTRSQLQFTVARDEQVVIGLYFNQIIDGVSKNYKIVLLFTRGTGTYGFDAAAVNADDFITISQQLSNPITDTNANFIDFGEIGEVEIQEFLNAADVEFTVKTNETNYFRALRDGILHTYLYSNRLLQFPQEGQNLAALDFELLARDGKALNDLPIPENLSQLNDDIGATDLKTILVRDKSQIVNQVLNPDRTYKIAVPALVLGAGDSIIVPAGGLIIKGYGFNVTSIVQPNDNGVIYTSPEGGSGNLNLIHLNSVASGENGRVFDVADVDGSHEVGFNSVNFSGCKSLGVLDGFRQGTANDMGVYACADGLTLAGAWNGFKIESTNVFGFGAAGTLFKKAADTSFSNRLFINVNLDFPMGAALCDFDTTNFEAPELFQINSSIAKVDGIINIDAAGWLLPNISANDIKSLWVGNIGLPDTATELLTENDNVNGVFEIDWLKDTYFLTLTGDTTFTQKNLPANTKNTQEIRLYVTGDFIPTFPLGWTANIVGTYKGADVNEIAIKYIRDGLYFVRISNTLSVYPAPIIGQLQPPGLLPNSTSELLIPGSFFTPQGFVKIAGQIINSIDFLPDTGFYSASVSTGAVEGDFDVEVNNGTSSIKERALTVSLGEVYKLSSQDFENVSPSITVDSGDLIKNDISTIGFATSAIVQPRNINWEIRINQRVSPLYGSYKHGDSYLLNAMKLEFKKVSDNSTLFFFYDVSEGNSAKIYTDGIYGKSGFPITANSEIEYWNDNSPIGIRYNAANLTVKIFYKGIEKGVKVLPAPLDSDLYMVFSLKQMNVKDIKYIELAN